MSLYQVDLSVTQGEDRTFGPYIFASGDPSGLNDLGQQAYYDFTGAHARMQVRENQDPSSLEILALTDSTSAITFTAVRSPGGPAAPTDANAITVVLAKAMSLLMPVGSFYYDLFVDWPAGTSQLALTGTFTVIPSVTR